jgi:hypothetical protein
MHMRHGLMFGFCSLGSMAACGHTLAPAPTTMAEDDRKVLIGQPCTTIPSVAPEGGAGLRQVFVEVARVPASVSLAPGARHVEHPVEVEGVLSLLARDEVATPVPWERCPTPGCRDLERRTLTVTPHLLDAAADGLRIDLALTGTGSEHGAVARVSIASRDQESTLVDLRGTSDEAPLRMIVTPYLLDGEHDMKKLLACKTAAAQGARRTDTRSSVSQ